MTMGRSTSRYTTCLLAVAALMFGVPALPGAAPKAAAVADIVTMLPPGVVRSNGADLRWSRFASMDGNTFVRYEVHRSLTAGFAASASTLLSTISDLNTTQWSDTSAAASTAFYYRVRAFSVAGLPAQTAELAVTTPAAQQARLTVSPNTGAGQATYIAADSTSPAGCVDWLNYGAAGTVRVGVSGDGMVRRPLLRFDLRDIPAGASVVSATLTLQYPQLPTAVSTGQLDVHRLTRDWTEGAGPDAGACDGSGANWPETRGDTRWTEPGGDLAAIPAASVPAKTRSAAGSDIIDVRALVQQWVSGQAPNHGLLIKAASVAIPASGDQSFGYHSDDVATAASRPALTVTYTDGNSSKGPVVALTEPVPGVTVYGQLVPLKASAGDDSRVTKVEFISYVGSYNAVFATDTAAPYEATYDMGTQRYADLQFAVRATDDAGNVTTTAVQAVSVNNDIPPYTEVLVPAVGAQVSGTVTLEGLTDYPAERAQFVIDGEIVGDVVDGFCWDNCSYVGFRFYWDTRHPLRPVANGTHALVVRTSKYGRWTDSQPVTFTVQNDAADQYEVQLKLNDPASTADDVVPAVVAENTTAGVPVQDPYGGTIDPATGLTGGSLNKSLASPPSPSGVGQAQQTATSCPSQSYCAAVWIKNDSARAWDGGKVKLWYRWFSDNGAVLYEAPSDTPLPAAFAAGQAQSVPVTIHPPKLPPGAELGRYHLRLDLYDENTSNWFSSMGRKPVDNPVVVAKTLNDRLGLERFWQYDSEDLGAGMSSLTNVANGNMLLRWSPFFAAGRGLGTLVDLTYNALEDHSRSPVGNNFSLSMSGLIRFGDPLDIHPNKADEIGGKSNKWVEFVDGDGTLHRFTGTTGADGITRWTEPPGVNLYLRSIPANPADRRWALTRPDKVTFYFDDEGFPTAVVDRNGNTISYLLETTPPGEDPGGPNKRITRVTDAGGRSFTIDYFSKDEAKKAHVRGKVQRILDHSGSVLDFEYYDDGNLLRLIQRGGTKATGELLPDRTFVFTYTTSNGAGPAIADPAARANPDPKTHNQSTRIFSVRDPRGAETTYDYYIPSEAAQLRWMLQARTNRLGHTTSYGYDLTQRITTVNAPLSRTTRFSYDTDGKVTRIDDAKNETSLVEWSADFKVTKLTEPTTAFTSFGYNGNGYLTSRTDQLGNRTELTYLDQQVDADDSARHLSLLATVTNPKGVATAGVPNDFQWRYAYDAAGNIDTVTDPTGAVTNYDYNGAGTANPGTVAAIRDANGNAPTTFPSYDPSGQPTEVVDPLGNRTRFGYDVDGLLRWAQDPNHADDTGADERAYKAFLDYDSYHRLGRQSAPKSTRLDRGRLIWSSADYDPNDNVVRRVQPHYGSASDSGTTGPVSTAVFDAMDQPTEITNPDTSVDPMRERTSYGYDAAGRVTKQTRPKGVLSATVDDYTTTYGYDVLDRVIKQTEYGTSTTQTRVTQLCYDTAGDMRSITSPRAGTATITCPGTGPAVAGYTSEFDYDDAHRQVTKRDELGHAQRTEYDANGNVTAREADITTGRVNRTEVDYDQRDKPVTQRERFDGTTGRNATTRFQYDLNGNRTRVISPRAYDTGGVNGPYTYYVTVNDYDAVNQLIRTTLPYDGRDGTERQYAHRSYDANGNLAWSSLPVTQPNATLVGAGAKTTMTYFDPGWIRTSDDPANPAVHFDYTATGQQSQRTPELKSAPGTPDTGKTMIWTFYADDMVASRSDQGGQAARYFYDADDNLTSSTDSGGVTDASEHALETQSTFTGYDEVAKTRHRKQGSTVWTFTDYTYDDNGNTTVRRENGEENDAGTQSKAPRRYELTYDGADWLTEQRDLGVDSACRNDSRTVNTFWGTGQEKQRDTYRAGATCTADPATWTKKQATNWTHFDNGKLRTLTTNNGAGTTTEKHTVSYFDTANTNIYVNGNRTKDTQGLMRGAGSTATTCTPASPCDAVYTYDARDKVLSEARNGKTTTYKLDEAANQLGDNTIRAGNVTTRTVDGLTTTQRYTGNQLTDVTAGASTAKYWYDDQGNQDCITTAAGSQTNCNTPSPTAAVLADYTYDYLNRLSSVRQFSGGAQTDKSSYVYDALDRTTTETEDHTGTGNDRTTNFTYQGLSSLLTEEKQSGGTAPKTKAYSYDNFGHKLGMTDTDNSTAAVNSYSYGTDMHGSISQLIDDTGNVKASYGYSAYGGADSPPTDAQSLTAGDTNAQAPINPMRYSGKRTDSGTANSATAQPDYDMGARRYGPNTGRFLQADAFAGALGDLGLALDPLTQNRYALAGGNPISYVETDGHMAIADGGGGGSATPAPPPPPPEPSLKDKATNLLGGLWNKGKDKVEDKFKDTKDALDELDAKTVDNPDWKLHGVYEGWKKFEEKAEPIVGATDVHKCAKEGGFGNCAWAAAAVIPGGKALKSPKAAKPIVDAARAAGGKRPVVIGETMDRVTDASRYFDAHHYRPWKDNYDAATGMLKDFDLGMARNKRTINDWMDEGRLLINIGLDPKRGPADRGPFYAMEIGEVADRIAKRGFSNIINVRWP